MPDEVDELRDLPDPVERAKRVGELIGRYQARLAELARMRREAIDDLRAGGLSQAQVAKHLGLTRGRVAQLASAGPPPERAFLGTDTVTVAIGSKTEASKPTGRAGPAVAQEDFRAYEEFREICRAYDLDTSYEFVAPPGIVHLNRDNLAVICGPRLSPLLAQVIESDTALEFTSDDAGWHLMERATHAVYRSPMDQGRPADVGYLARLPRPDGKGSFLYIAGIHAVGATGVIHYLERDLAEVYREVRTRRFSTLVSCEFDPSTLEIKSSERITALFRHEGS